MLISLAVGEVDNLKRGRWEIDFGGLFMDSEQVFEDSVGVSENQSREKIFL